MLYLSSVLVPLDGSSVAEQALPLATQLVKSWGAKLRLVSVHPQVAAYPAMEGGLLDPELDRQLRERELGYLQEVAKRIAHRNGLDIECAVLEGVTADSLEDYVKRTRTDLVVMTSHARGGLGRLVLGNVADQLVRRLEVPVLVFPPT